MKNVPFLEKLKILCTNDSKDDPETLMQVFISFINLKLETNPEQNKLTLIMK